MFRRCRTFHDDGRFIEAWEHAFEQRIDLRPAREVEQFRDAEHLLVGEVDFAGTLGHQVGGQFIKPFEIDLPVGFDA